RVVVALDLRHRDRPRDPGPLVELARVSPQVGVLDDPPVVAAEMRVVNLVEARERREQAPVGLGELLPREIATLAEQPLQPAQAVEYLPERLLVRLLQAGEAGAVDAVVDGVIDARVERVELLTQLGRAQIQPEP